MLNLNELEINVVDEMIETAKQIKKEIEWYCGIDNADDYIQSSAKSNKFRDLISWSSYCLSLIQLRSKFDHDTLERVY